jgi:hypothetical protein
VIFVLYHPLATAFGESFFWFAIIPGYSAFFLLNLALFRAWSTHPGTTPREWVRFFFFFFFFFWSTSGLAS